MIEVEQQTEMIEGLGEIEAGLTAVARGVERHRSACRALTREAHESAVRRGGDDAVRSGGWANSLVGWNAVIGEERLHRIIAMRMRALGLEGVLNEARASGTVSSSWVSELTKRIQGLVR